MLPAPGRPAALVPASAAHAVHRVLHGEPLTAAEAEEFVLRLRGDLLVLLAGVDAAPDLVAAARAAIDLRPTAAAPLMATRVQAVALAQAADALLAATRPDTSDLPLPQPQVGDRVMDTASHHYSHVMGACPDTGLVRLRTPGRSPHSAPAEHLLVLPPDGAR